MLRSISFLITLVCLLSTVLSAAESKLFTEWKANPETATLPDFSYAGYGGDGQLPPEIPTSGMPVFDVADYGAIPNDTDGDQKEIQAAIHDAVQAGGGIVKLHAGEYRINTDYGDDAYSLFIRGSNIILQGAGSDKTTIYSPNKMARDMGPWTLHPMLSVDAPVVKGGQGNYGYSEYQPPITHSWFDIDIPDDAGTAGRYFYADPDEIITTLTVDAARNSRELIVANASQLRAGDLVVVCARSPKAADELLGPWDHTKFEYLTGNGLPGEKNTNLVRQIVTVASVSGNTVTIKERLRWSYPAAHDVVILDYPYIENVGVAGIRFKGDVVNNVPEVKYGLKFTNVYNGWIKDVVFYNFKTAATLIQSKNCTVIDAVLDGDGGSSGDYFDGYHNSFKFLGHTSDCIIENARIVRGVTHGLSAQRHANGNVFLNCELAPDNTDGMNSRIDQHSQIPMANLYDNLKNGEANASGGNAGTQPHSGPLTVFWNWQSEISNEQTVWAGYGEFQLQMIRPVWVGLTSSRGTPTIQFAGNHDFYRDDSVVVESIGTPVEPHSLYLAQVQERVGRSRVAGAYIVLNGPTTGFTDTDYTFTTTGSVGSGLSYTWDIDGTAKSGESITHSFSQPGEYVVRVTGTTSNGQKLTTQKTVRIYDNAGVLIDATGEVSELYSRTLAKKGVMWQFMPLAEFGDSTIPHATDNALGFEGIHIGASIRFGGTWYTEMPATGFDASSPKIDLTFSESLRDNNREHTVRIAARDADGTWAVSTNGVNAGTHSFDIAEWQTPESWMGLSSEGSFDSNNVTAIGVLAHTKSTKWVGLSHRFLLESFKLNAGKATKTVGALPTSMLSSLPRKIGGVGNGVEGLTLRVAPSVKAVLLFDVQGKLVHRISPDAKTSYSVIRIPGSVMQDRILFARYLSR